MNSFLHALRSQMAFAAAVLALGCALVLAAPVVPGAAEEGAGGEITPGKGVGPINLGMPLDDLTRLWGPSAEKGERSEDGVALRDYSDAQGVLVFLKDDHVVQLVVVTPAWATPSGAKVGATWPQVRAFLGQPEETIPGQTKDETRYLYRQRGLAFILRGRAVAAIVVLAPQVEATNKGPLDDLLGSGKKGQGRGQGQGPGGR